jgi:SAM-dependent methyltransferase
MLEKLTEASQRLRRNVAQRGLRNAIGNVLRRIRTRDFSAAPAQPLVLEGSHPFDEATGLDTGGFIHGSQLQNGHPHDLYTVCYYGTAPSLVEGVLDRWLKTPERKPVEEYTFIDFGSGKGRVVLLASKLPFRKCIGVELNANLNQIAAENMRRWQKMGNSASPIQAICQEATEFQFPDTPCLVYLFNPFTSKVLALLLEHIAQVFANRPGELDLLYVNAEFGYLLEQHPGFAQLWHMQIEMSPEDSAADLLKPVFEPGANQSDKPLGEPCSGWRWVGMQANRVQ